MCSSETLIDICICYQRNKKRAECIVEFYKHAGIFKNTREVPRSTPRTPRVFLKILKCLYNSTMLEAQVLFISFNKMYRELRALGPMT